MRRVAGGGGASTLRLSASLGPNPPSARCPLRVAPPGGKVEAHHVCESLDTEILGSPTAGRCISSLVWRAAVRESMTSLLPHMGKGGGVAVMQNRRCGAFGLLAEIICERAPQGLDFGPPSAPACAQPSSRSPDERDG